MGCISNRSDLIRLLLNFEQPPIGDVPLEGRIAEGPVGSLLGDDRIGAQADVVAMSRPAVQRRFSHQPGSYRIHVDIAHTREQVAIGFDHRRPVPTLPQRPGDHRADALEREHPVHGQAGRACVAARLSAVRGALEKRLAGRVDAAVVWNPWVNKIQTSGKGKPLFTSKDVPGLVPDLLVVQEKSLRAKRKDFVGMVKAWYDVEAFLRSNPDEAAKIMSKVVGLNAKEYAVFLPGTRFFDQKSNLQAFGPATDPTSLMGVAPTISKFLLDNKLMEGKVDFAKGLDASLVKEVAGVK